MTDETVVEKDNERDENPDSADAGTQDNESLESILAQYDADVDEGKQPKQQQKSDDIGGLDPATVSMIKDFVKEQQSKSVDEALNQAIETMKSSIDAEVNLPDSMWKGLLYYTAESNPRFMRAFVERRSNPAGFNKALKALAKELSGDLKVSKPDTETRNSVTAAVRAGKKQAPASDEDGEEAFRKKFLNASPAEKAKMKQEIERRVRMGA